MEEEKYILTEVFGNYPLIRILNHLLIFREFDYSLTDIAENSGVAWSTLNALWPKLEKLGLVVHTRNVGRAKMYKLNTGNRVTKQLIQFADTLVWEHEGNGISRKKRVMAAHR